MTSPDAWVYRTSMKLRAILLTLAISMLLPACSRRRARFTARAVEEVQARAAFDFECPADEIETEVLARWQSRPKAPKQVGAVGCGHRAVYVKTVSGWVLNTAGGSD